MSDAILKGKLPIRSKVWDEESYQHLDPGIRFAVRVLHANGIETGQSCQGGKGHSYDYPTIEFGAGADDANGFRALAILQTYGLKVFSLSIHWAIFNGLPYEKLWRIEFVKPMLDRASDKPELIWGYQFQPTKKKRSGKQ